MAHTDTETQLRETHTETLRDDTHILRDTQRYTEKQERLYVDTERQILRHTHILKYTQDTETHIIIPLFSAC